jgi:hypothetical protein
MKAIAILLVALMALLSVAPAAMAHETGGLVGGIIGCCLGVRSAAAYNEGKDLHWREWCRLIPCANIVFSIWDGVDGANGRTAADLANEYGSNFY